MTDPFMIIEPGGPSHSMCVFFRHNPDEFLDRKAVAAKLRIPPVAVDSAMRPAVEAGLLTIAHDGDFGRVWRAGPRLKHWILLADKPAPAPSPTSKPASRKGGTRTYLPVIKAELFEAVSGVPLPNNIDQFGLRGRTKYDIVFDKLVADDQCLRGFDIAYKPAMKKALVVYLKRRPEISAHSQLRVFRIDDKTCGIWRTAKTVKP